jgi:[acyl-carrier-protein] S-malonyltransferase
MGRDLIREFPETQTVFEAADEALGYSLSELMFRGEEAALRQTENAQPALLVHSIATLTAITTRTGLSVSGLCSAVLGHSLGEYSALCGAGCLSLSDAVRVVRQRGQWMAEAVPNTLQTAMVALFPVEADYVRSVCSSVTAETGQVCDVASINSPSQVVISGAEVAVSLAVATIKAAQRRVKVVPLAVSAPFHCKLMAPAAAHLEGLLESTVMTPPCVPLLSNVDAREVTDTVAIRRLLVRQLTSPVLFRGCVEMALDSHTGEFWEVGGGMLCGSITQTSLTRGRGSKEGPLAPLSPPAPPVTVRPLGTAEDVRTLLTALEQVEQGG